tara:strand:- start:6151 stop:6861 length:711 start_codon:yes stop_codon:yes gene_type:complete
MISDDSKQRVKVLGIFLLQIYKITTGTMMSLFIPQSCGDKMCSLTENYKNSELYHKTLFYWNSFSMFLFLICYGIELRREEWCVKYLDIDNNYPDNSLKNIIVKEKTLDNKMDKLNKYYYDILLGTSITYFINMLLTIKMINDNYHSNSTISCFMSFSLLVLMKIYNSWNVAYQSVKNDKMMSAYMCEFVSFNVLDTDYVNEKYNGKKNNRLEDISDEEKVIDHEEIIPMIDEKNN